MTEETQTYDIETLEAMNEKALRNQFFTPDVCYIELGLFKDFHLGALFLQHLVIEPNEEAFAKLQNQVTEVLLSYQTREFDTIELDLGKFGYSDEQVEEIWKRTELHDQIFTVSPASNFLNLLIRHNIRNQNHSKPADKYVKRKLDGDQYVLDAIPIRYYINTFPLTLSSKAKDSIGEEIANAFGVDVAFLNQDPATFGKTEWDEWMESVDAFYVDSLGRFQRSSFIVEKQGDMQFAGCYLFARKRFEKDIFAIRREIDFEQEIQRVTALLGFQCDFEWLTNTDLRLGDEPEPPPSDTEEPS